MNYNFNNTRNPSHWQEMSNMPPYLYMYHHPLCRCSTCFRSGWQNVWHCQCQLRELKDSSRDCSLYGWQCGSVRLIYYTQHAQWLLQYSDTEMKREREGDDECNDTTHPASKKSFWAAGLLAAMRNPKCILKEDDRIVVIADKYPKAEHHFLILPKDDISNISKLNQEHIPLLQHMEAVGREVSKEHADHTFLFGYHALASMIRLHLHVISDDFNSPALKTKKHWNSFTTPFFISSEELITSIQKDGKIKQMSSSMAKELMDTPLKCHKCSMKLHNMPKLKQHLLVHRLKEKHATQKK